MKRAFIAVVLVLCAFDSAQAEGKGEFGGHDAFGLTSNQQIQTDCKITWEDASSKKTYCFSTEQMKADFAKDTAGNLAKAEANYKILSAKKEVKAEHAKVEVKGEAKTGQVKETAKQGKAVEAKPADVAATDPKSTVSTPAKVEVQPSPQPSVVPTK